MYDQQIKLVKETKTVDSYGDTSITETSKEVFAEVRSIGMKEFYEAQANGLQPEIKFVLADNLDYSGEEKIKFKKFGDNTEKTYDVIRTFSTGTEIELTCKKAVE